MADYGEPSSFQYTYYNPSDDRWWCRQGPAVYAAKIADAPALAKKIKNMNCRFSIKVVNGMYEATPIF